MSPSFTIARCAQPKLSPGLRLSLFVSVALGVALWHVPARACKCAPLTPREAYEQADAVFEGRVIEIQIDGSAKDSAPRLRARFAAVRAWKGVRSEIVEVVTPSESAACGFGFERDTSYFVYSSEQDGILVTTSCSRTRKMADANDDVRELGMGATPVEVRAEPRATASSKAQAAPVRRGGCASCTLVSGSGTGGLASASLAFAFVALCARVTSRRRSGSRS